MERLAMLLYGVVCYAIGMGALVYLILFTVVLPGVSMPVTVDSGAPASLMIALLVTAYILIGVAYEERDLIRAFGKSYSDYRARAPAYTKAR